MKINKKYIFDGKTYNVKLDYERLKNNTQRVFVLLLDGKWHGKKDLEEVGGAAYDSRVRDLRKKRFGGFTITEERDPYYNNTFSRYKLDVQSVNKDKIQKIIYWNIEEETKTSISKLEKRRQKIISMVKTANEKTCKKLESVLIFKSFWLSSNKMTISVDTNRKGIIIFCAPIVRKFKGQHIKKLVKWMRKHGGFKAKEITPA